MATVSFGQSTKYILSAIKETKVMINEAKTDLDRISYEETPSNLFRSPVNN